MHTYIHTYMCVCVYACMYVQVIWPPACTRYNSMYGMYVRTHMHTQLQSMQLLAVLKFKHNVAPPHNRSFAPASPKITGKYRSK